MEKEPSDEELLEFIGSMLSNLENELSEPAVVEEALRERRDMWVKLFRASMGFEVPDRPV